MRSPAFRILLTLQQLKPVSASIMSDQPTPMMAQYIEIKAAYPDSLLFYRMGDFYELFFGDAEIAARALGITLTKRGKHLGDDIPMCGVPVHAADDYLQKLIALGHRVAVCEQVEDPAEAKKRGSKSVVKRDVVRLVTPGTITEENLLEAGAASLLVTLARIKGGAQGDQYALAAVDISTGSFVLVETDLSKLSSDLARIQPRELVLPDTLFEEDELRLALEMIDCAVQPQPASLFDSSRAEQSLQRFFNVATLDGFGAFSRAELAAASAAIAYIEKTQIGERPVLSRPTRENSSSVLYIDAATRDNLELIQTMSGSREGSLLKTIDRTVCGGGSRLLAHRLMNPTTNVKDISTRLDDVAWFLSRETTRENLRQILKGVADMPRALSRLSLNRGGPRDLYSIKSGLGVAGKLSNLVQADAVDLPENLHRLVSILENTPHGLVEHLSNMLSEELPLRPRDGGICKSQLRFKS